MTAQGTRRLRHGARTSLLWHLRCLRALKEQGRKTTNGQPIDVVIESVLRQLDEIQQ